LKDVEVSGELADAARAVSEAVGLEIQVTLQEVKRISESASASSTAPTAR